MQKISKTFKYQLLPSQEQEQTLNRWVGACRFLYNSALEHRVYMYGKGQRVSEYDQSNTLKDIKRTEGLEFFKEIPAQCLQQVLKRLNRSYENFFRGSGFPKYKRRGEGDSVHFPTPSHFKIRPLTKNKSAIKLPKLEEIRFRQSRPLEGRVRNATVIKNHGKWYLCINCELEIEQKINLGPAVGIDLGVAQTVSLSSATANGEQTFSLPQKVETLEKRISKLQKKLKNKKRFSQNWKKLVKIIGHLHMKLARIRQDFCHKVSHQLTKNHSLLVMEDLKVKNMSKSASGTKESPGKNVKAKSGLNRSILRQGWYMFRSFCEYKAQWYGSGINFVDPKYSSQTCSECGCVDAGSRLSQSEFFCTSCGFKINADINAAKIILTRGRRGRACGDDGVAHVYEAGTSMALKGHRNLLPLGGRGRQQNDRSAVDKR